jgi:biotin operon repressor
MVSFFSFTLPEQRSDRNKYRLPMNKHQRQSIKARLIKLADLKCTGAPSELALKLEVSERTIKRMIKEIRDEGIDISYSLARQSYVTNKDFM